MFNEGGETPSFKHEIQYTKLVKINKGNKVASKRKSLARQINIYI